MAEATRTPVVLVLLATVAVAGCLAGPSPGDDAGTGALAFHHFEGWENPDEPIRALVSHDVDGDGFDELFVGQVNGSITALDVRERSTLWQIERFGTVEAMTFVGGARGPALAAAGSSSIFDPFGTRLTLLDAANGSEIATREIDRVYPGRIAATDVTDDGTEDVLLAGVTPEATDPDLFGSRTAVVAVDGTFESEDEHDVTDILTGDPAVLWRTRLDGRVLDLGVPEDDRIVAATRRLVATLSLGGETIWEHRTDRIEHVALDDGGILVIRDRHVSLLGTYGTERWTEATRWPGRLAAVGDLGDGPEAFVVTRDVDNETLHLTAYRADGESRAERTLALPGTASAVAVGEIARDRPVLAVATSNETGDGTTLGLYRHDLARVYLGTADHGHPDDRLRFAELVPTGERELVLAGYHARLDVFGTV